MMPQPGDHFAHPINDPDQGCKCGPEDDREWHRAGHPTHPLDALTDNADDAWMLALAERTEIMFARVLGLPTRSRVHENLAAHARRQASLIQSRAWARYASGNAGLDALLSTLAAENRFVPRRGSVQRRIREIAGAERRAWDAFIMGVARRGAHGMEITINGD